MIMISGSQYAKLGEMAQIEWHWMIPRPSVAKGISFSFCLRHFAKSGGQGRKEGRDGTSCLELDRVQELTDAEMNHPNSTAKAQSAMGISGISFV